MLWCSLFRLDSGNRSLPHLAYQIEKDVGKNRCVWRQSGLPEIKSSFWGRARGKKSPYTLMFSSLETIPSILWKGGGTKEGRSWLLKATEICARFAGLWDFLPVLYLGLTLVTQKQQFSSKSCYFLKVNTDFSYSYPTGFWVVRGDVSGIWSITPRGRGKLKISAVALHRNHRQSKASAINAWRDALNSWWGAGLRAFSAPFRLFWERSRSFVLRAWLAGLLMGLSWSMHLMNKLDSSSVSSVPSAMTC